MDKKFFYVGKPSEQIEGKIILLEASVLTEHFTLKEGDVPMGKNGRNVIIITADTTGNSKYFLNPADLLDAGKGHPIFLDEKGKGVNAPVDDVKYILNPKIRWANKTGLKKDWQCIV